ncbi:MAG: type II secretion system protein [Planctomycetes bacterium]|nr:type II secretion system protein [Planctomycetota bacterium]
MTPLICRPGFTLVEMLIAIGLVMVLLGAALSFWAYTSAGVERLSDRMERQHGVRIFLEHLEREITSSLVGYASLGGGVRGDDASIRLLLRGVDVGAAATGAGGDAAAVERDLQEVTYRFEAGQVRVSTTDGGESPLTPGGRNTTVRPDESEGEMMLPDVPLGDGTPTAQSGGGGVIAGDIGLIRFRYHDGSNWVDSFDSWAKGRLPAAIEVSVWFHPLPQSEQDLPAEFGMDQGEPDAMGDGPSEPDLFGEDEFAMPGTESELPPPDLVRLVLVPDGPTYEPGRSFEDVEEGLIEADEPGGAPAGEEL